MQWLRKVADEVEKRQPEGEIIIESGVSPSGTYHVGTLREVLTSDAVLWELARRGRQARHIHYVDDLDVLRKVPVNVPEDYKQYLGRPYCDIPAPDGSDQSYASYFLSDFLEAAKKLRMDMEVIRSHERYRSGFMVPAIEKALLSVDKIRQIIEEASGRKLEADWAPIQVMEDEYLKSRPFVSINTDAKTIVYKDKDGQQRQIGYTAGLVKLNWRVDWPGRWWLLEVTVEPFGRDHATKGGSYDTGAQITKKVFEGEPPIPVPYNFIHKVGETKKMSKSTGDIIAISDIAKVLPPEVVRFFVLRYPPEKALFFDVEHGVAKLIDDFAALLAKENKSEDEEDLIKLCTAGLESTVSSVPFSHLTASYQAALKDPAKTLKIIERTEHQAALAAHKETIKEELKFIDTWLDKWAPEEAKFQLQDKVDAEDFSQQERDYLKSLAQKIAQAPQDADGEWFHEAIYEFQDSLGLSKQELFTTLYKALIGKESGPRAGWFLSILPRDWLINRLNLES